jgi:DNA-binding NtrC family response regulator
MARILVVDNDAECRSLITHSLESDGHIVDEAPDSKKAVSAACVYAYDMVILDIDLPKRGGIRALQAILDECPEVTIIAKCERDTCESAAEAMKRGAYDFLCEPLHAEVIKFAVDRALDHRRLLDQNSHLLEELKGIYSFDTVTATNPAAKKAYQVALEIAKTDSPVLVRGESGTGKEYVARSIHFKSERAAGPFVRLACSGLSDEAIEAELFGREKGSSRDASSRRVGRIELAAGGTLFLDEIADLGDDTQDKILRVLQHKEYERVGGSRTFTADVRVIASSTTNGAETGPDNVGTLCDYLNVFTINLPPLRERTEDIPALARYFAGKYAQETGKSVTGISEQAMMQILACEWKGNIRELENCVERAMMLCDGEAIQPVHLNINGSAASKRKQNVAKPLRDIERDHIKRVLIHCNWNKSAAAGILQIDRKTLRCKIREFGFAQPDE